MVASRAASRAEPRVPPVPRSRLRAASWSREESRLRSPAELASWLDCPDLEESPLRWPPLAPPEVPPDVLPEADPESRLEPLWLELPESFEELEPLAELESLEELESFDELDELEDLLEELRLLSAPELEGVMSPPALRKASMTICRCRSSSWARMRSAALLPPVAPLPAFPPARVLPSPPPPAPPVAELVPPVVALPPAAGLPPVVPPVVPLPPVDVLVPEDVAVFPPEAPRAGAPSWMSNGRPSCRSNSAMTSRWRSSIWAMLPASNFTGSIVEPASLPLSRLR